MVCCVAPASRHPVPKPRDIGGENLVATGDLEKSVRAFGLTQYFRFDFFNPRGLSISTGEIGFLFKFPQVVSHLAEFLVVVSVR